MIWEDSAVDGNMEESIWAMELESDLDRVVTEEDSVFQF